MHSEDELLFLWMTHRFVEPKSNVDIESSAREYLETLIIRSFLQKSEYESKGFVMLERSASQKIVATGWIQIIQMLGICF